MSDTAIEALRYSEFPNSSDCISRQATIDALADMHCKSDEDGYVWIIRSDAWARIDALPSAQSEYRLDEWCTDCKEYDTEKHCCPRFNQVIRTTLNEMKSERKKGKWKTALLDHEAFGVRPKVLYCSECNQCIAYPTRYCPNCGADMRGEQGDND